jgi:hypothetical protein
MQNFKAMRFDNFFGLDQDVTAVSIDRLMRFDLAEARVTLSWPSRKHS